jgi:tol-pal system protein YbgF
MIFRRLLVCVLFAAPSLSMPAFAASKEIVELQRDLGMLQQQVKDLQRSQDEKFAGLQVLVQQAVDGANKANTSVAVIQSSLSQSLKDQQAQVVGPVVVLRTSIDNVSNDLRTVQQAVSDLASLMSRMQAQLTDLGNAVKLINTPPVAPPQQPGPTPGGTQSGPGNAVPGTAEVPPILSKDLYDNATRDKGSGKLDLALQEFADYLKWYGNTELAPNAQFYIGMIHYGQGNFDAAVKDFDMVLERFHDNNKTPDARLYKGKSLVRMQGHKTEGADEFKELIKRYPNTDSAKLACTELTSLGLRCGPPVAPPRGTAKRSARK